MVPCTVLEFARDVGENETGRPFHVLLHSYNSAPRCSVRIITCDRKNKSRADTQIPEFGENEVARML